MFLLWKVCSSFCSLCCRDCSYGWYGFWSQIFGFPWHSIWSKLHLMSHLCFSWDGYFWHGDVFLGCSCMMLVCDHWFCIVRSGSIRDLIECGCFSLLKSHRFWCITGTVREGRQSCSFHTFSHSVLSLGEFHTQVYLLMKFIGNWVPGIWTNDGWQSTQQVEIRLLCNLKLEFETCTFATTLNGGGH